uniref:Uncharacterized protein n=1 Tax=Salix viminalis TaxID=40686 RepID=A0A6N2KAI9_SALVM
MLWSFVAAPPCRGFPLKVFPAVNAEDSAAAVFAPSIVSEITQPEQKKSSNHVMASTLTRYS